MCSHPLSVIKSVLKREHPALGRDVVVEEYGSSGAQSPNARSSVAAEPLEIPVDPIFFQSLTRKLEQSLITSRVKCSANEEKRMLVFSPTGESIPNWRQEIEELVPHCLTEMAAETIHVPKEAVKKAGGLLVSLNEKDLGVKFNPSGEGVEITLAGETSSVTQALGSLHSELVVEMPPVTLSPKKIAFMQQVRRHDFPATIECTFDRHKLTLVLKGPIGLVRKVHASLEDIANHCNTPILLQPLITEFFKTPIGRSKLEGYLQGSECRIGVYFVESNAVLHLLADHKDANLVRAVADQLPLFVDTKTILVPDPISPTVTDSEEFIQLCKDTEKKHEVLIKPVGQEITAAGFKAQVTSCLVDISAYLKAKASPPPPLQIEVGELVAKSIQHSPQGLQKCLSSRMETELRMEAERDALRFIPLQYLTPDWEKKCRKVVSDYIKDRLVERSIEMPELASSEVSSVLLNSQQHDRTFVYITSATSVSFAGAPDMVKVTEDTIVHICSNLASINEGIPLAPDLFQLIKQVKLQSMKSKFRSVSFKLSSKPPYCLTVNGPTKEVKEVRQYIPKLMTRKVSVPIDVQRAILKYLTSEKGRERLLDVVQEKRGAKCALYTDDSMEELSLVCTHKNRPTAERICKVIVECTLIRKFNIPDLLKPFFNELPELKRIVEEEISAITVDGNEIVVAGFKDEVSKAVNMLSELVKDKVYHFQPVLIPIDPMIALCVENNIEILQKCVSSIHVTCKVNKKTDDANILMSPTTETMPGWKEEGKRLVLSYIDCEYSKEVVSYAEEATEYIAPVFGSNKNFVFKVGAEGESATLAGEKSAVEEVKKAINHICSNNKISREIKFLHQEYDFFEQIVQKKMEGMVAFELSQEKHSVTIRGYINDVIAVGKSIKESIHHIKVPIFVDPPVVRFISTVGNEKLQCMMRDAGITAAIHIKVSITPPTLELLCVEKSAHYVAKFADSIPKLISTTCFPCSKALAKPPLFKELQKFCQELAVKHHVLIEVEQEKVQICGFKEEVKEVSGNIEHYIRNKCSARVRFPIEKGMWRLLTGHMKPMWDEIEGACRGSDIALKELTESEEKCIVEFKGDASNIQKVTENLNRLVQSIYTTTMSLENPQICQYFCEKGEGAMQIPGIEKRATVVIEVCSIGSKEEKTSSKFSPSMSQECSAKVVDMKHIAIHVGDITEFRADVIVNAANEDLKHIGGLAYTILRKGGKEIQHASDQYMRSRAKLCAGDVWLSQVVGKLPCLALVHAVGPRWHNNPAAKQQLIKVCNTCFTAAKDYSSIALPAISSGVFGCPINQCAEVMVAAAVEFCKSQRYAALSEINIVLFKESDVFYFVRALETHVPPDNIHRRPKKPGASLPSSPMSSVQLSLPPAHPQKPEEKKIYEEMAGSSLSRVCITEGSILDVKVRLIL